MAKPISTRAVPDEFQMALARLAGLDPEQVVAGTLNVNIERDEGRETVSTITATVRIDVDPDAVIELAMKHDRLAPVDH